MVDLGRDTGRDNVRDDSNNSVSSASSGYGCLPVEEGTNMPVTMHRVAWLAACLTLLLGASASAQTTFLSNDGFAHDDNPLWLSNGVSQIAQPFRSGELSTDEIAANTAWLVTEVRVRLNFDNTRQVPTAKLCESLGSRAEKCQDLRGPTSASSGEQIIMYTHSGYPLESNMRRYLVLYWGGQPDEDVACACPHHIYQRIKELCGVGVTRQFECTGPS